MKTLKVLSGLLSYPSEAMVAAGAEMKAVLARRRYCRRRRWRRFLASSTRWRPLT